MEPTIAATQYADGVLGGALVVIARSAARVRIGSAVQEESRSVVALARRARRLSEGETRPAGGPTLQRPGQPPDGGAHDDEQVVELRVGFGRGRPRRRRLEREVHADVPDSATRSFEAEPEVRLSEDKEMLFVCRERMGVDLTGSDGAEPAGEFGGLPRG